MPGDTRPRELITLLKIAIEEGNDDLAAEIRSDLYREYGLEMNKGGLASLPGYAPGGPVGSDLFGANMPSHRADPENYFKSIKKIGEVTKKKFLKKDGSIDIKKFNRFAIKQGADPLDKSPKGILRFTKWMNSYLPKGLKYEPVMIDKPGPGAGTKVFTAESTIRQQPGTAGAGLNKEIYDKGQKLNRTALKKFPNSKTARLKYIVDGLYKTFNQYEGVTKKFLKNFVKGRGFLSITPMGVATSLAMEMMEDPDYMNAVGFGESEPLTYKGGGMADIYDMTQPLGYAEAGEVGPREDIIQKTDEMITYLNARVAELSFGTEPAAKIINDITEERRKENPDYDRLNKMYSQYKSMDDFAMKVYFTDKYDEPEKKGRSEKGFLNRILNTIHDVTMRPRDAEIGYNAGGIVSLNHLTRRL